MKSLLLLGSTGSIGTQTLELVRSAPERFRIEGLAARGSVEALLDQVREFRPRVVAVADPEAAARVEPELPPGTALVAGPDSALRLADEATYDLCVHGVVGAAGVQASVRVLERGLPLALANKESMVVAGEHLMELSRSRGAPILPVDSEHCALFQCLAAEKTDRVRRVFLTASGGALRDLDEDALERATPEQALEHPNWSMGPRITIDSATLMNKALEVIEAHHLYGLEAERIGVLVHRQSVVHALVEFVDGSVLAHMGPPDMRIPILYALGHPDRVPSDLVGFDPALFSRLTFDEPDHERFPCLALGHRCVREGGDSGASLNAADEVAVAAFLEGRIGFQDIARVNRSVLEQRTPLPPDRTDDVPALLAADARARQLAASEVDRLAARPVT
jgi:1-deoxy-D-xylulose-5-phosphate reductoisomerase